MSEDRFTRNLIKYVFRYYVRHSNPDITMSRLNVQTKVFMDMLDAESHKRATRKEANGGKRDGRVNR